MRPESAVPDLSVVIPLRDEEQNIRPLHDRVQGGIGKRGSCHNMPGHLRTLSPVQPVKGHERDMGLADPSWLVLWTKSHQRKDRCILNLVHDQIQKLLRRGIRPVQILEH